MGRISKYSNLYNKDGELIREAPLKPYTREELEELIDSMEPGKARDAATWMLFELYQKYGNPHEAELIEKLKQAAKIKTDEDQVERALGELGESIGEPVVQEENKSEVESKEDEVQGLSYDVTTLDTEDATIIEEYDTRKS